MELSVLIVNYQERDHLQRALRLLRQEFTSTDHEVIVVDNCSSDDSVAMVRSEFPEVLLLTPEKNLYYGKGNNLAMEASQGDWLMILNADVDWRPGQLQLLVERSRTIPHLGMAGPRLQFPDGRVQPGAHHHFPTWYSVLVDYCLPVQQLLLRAPTHPVLLSAEQHRRSQQVASLTGVCLVFPRTVYENTGGFDPAFSMYLEETEWQKRLADQGLSRWLIADAVITHYGSAQKSFAQASRHYLWGLRLYVSKHWHYPGAFACLVMTLWLATLTSLVLLWVLWPFSWFLGHAGQRVRHYTRAYHQLLINLTHYPATTPT